jgi:hypothetical protein
MDIFEKIKCELDIVYKEECLKRKELTTAFSLKNDTKDALNIIGTKFQLLEKIDKRNLDIKDQKSVSQGICSILRRSVKFDSILNALRFYFFLEIR